MTADENGEGLGNDRPVAAWFGRRRGWRRSPDRRSRHRRRRRSAGRDEERERRRTRRQGCGRAVLGPASGRDHDTSTKPHLFRRTRSRRRPNATRSDQAVARLDRRPRPGWPPVSRPTPIGPGHGDAGHRIPARRSACRPARLTVTFGFGAGLFVKDGKDRYGLADRRPRGAGRSAPLQRRSAGRNPHRRRSVDPGLRRRSAGRLSRGSPIGAVRLRRWPRCAGRRPASLPGYAAKRDTAQSDGLQGRHQQSVGRRSARRWRNSSGSASEGPDWMRGGSYLVVRRIRIALEHWDRMKVDFQEQTFGRHKYSGAPLGLKERVRSRSTSNADRQGRQPGHSRERPCPACRRGE